MKEDWKKNLLHTFLLLIFTTVILVVMNVVISGQEQEEELENTNMILNQTVKGVSFADQATFVKNLNLPYIRGFYEVFDDEEKRIGYLCRILADGYYKGKVFHLYFDTDGTISSPMKLYDDTENESEMGEVPLPEDFIMNLYNVRLPIMTDVDAARLKSAAAPILDGLIDGVYRKTANEQNRDDYFDFVEIHVEGGWIVDVTWDGISSEPDEKANRAQASLEDDYELADSENSWAKQAYYMEKHLLDIQDPSQIAVKSDGTTEVVSGVSCEITEFVSLAGQCVEAAKIGDFYDPAAEAALAAQENEDASDGSETEEGSDDSPDESGGEENMDPSSVADESSSETSFSTLPVSSENKKDRMDRSPIGTQDQNYSPGGEDGVIMESDEENGRIYGFSRDEIRTIIPGKETNLAQQQSILLSVNRAYSFLQTYLSQSR